MATTKERPAESKLKGTAVKRVATTKAELCSKFPEIRSWPKFLQPPEDGASGQWSYIVRKWPGRISKRDQGFQLLLRCKAIYVKPCLGVPPDSGLTIDKFKGVRVCYSKLTMAEAIALATKVAAYTPPA